MNVLALDLGTRTGWALAEAGRIESGVQDFSPTRGESAGMRYLRFNRWLQDVTHTPQVDLIVYEMPHLRGGAAATVLAGLETRVHEFCARAQCHPIEYQSVHSATLKKWVTGSGRGDKNAMMLAGQRRGWFADQPGHWPIDDNQGDAVCLLHYALSEIVPSGARR
jgi:Holliday junction resolvasome RuvABC endonuclease subunit